MTRRKHSADASVRCDICAPLTCSKAKPPKRVPHTCGAFIPGESVLGAKPAEDMCARCGMARSKHQPSKVAEMRGTVGLGGHVSSHTADEGAVDTSVTTWPKKIGGIPVVTGGHGVLIPPSVDGGKTTLGKLPEHPKRVGLTASQLVSCVRRDWCVLKAGHMGDCSPTTQHAGLELPKPRARRKRLHFTVEVVITNDPAFDAVTWNETSIVRKLLAQFRGEVATVGIGGVMMREATFTDVEDEP